MDAILENLLDPAWWFTAVFISILASIASAYLRDWLIHLTAEAPRKYQAWRERQIQNECAFVEMLASDATRLVIANIKVTRLLINFSVMNLIFIMIEGFALTSALIGNNGNLTFDMLPVVSRVLMIVGLIIGVLSIRISYMTVKRKQQVNRANRLYHSRQPAIPISRS